MTVTNFFSFQLTF